MYKNVINYLILLINLNPTLNKKSIYNSINKAIQLKKIKMS